MNQMKLAREKAGLSQGLLARKTGYSNSVITMTENNYMRSYPKLRERIASALEVQESEIFDEDGWVRDEKASS